VLLLRMPLALALAPVVMGEADSTVCPIYIPGANTLENWMTDSWIQKISQSSNEVLETDVSIFDESYSLDDETEDVLGLCNL
jgi:hypothetical protein